MTPKWNINYTLYTSAAVPAAIVAADTYAAGRIPINGSAAVITEAVLPVSGSVFITSAADDSGVDFTISGTLAGAPVTEILAGANTGTATSVNQYDYVQEIAASAATAGNITVGSTSGGDEIALAQTLGAPANVDLNGELQSGTVTFPTTSPYPFLLLTTTADETSNSFTVTGLDAAGVTQTLTLAGVNNTTLVFPIQLAVVQSLSVDNTTAGDISFGSGAQTASPWFRLDGTRRYFAVGVIVGLSPDADLNYKIEATNFDNNGNPIAILTDAILSSSTTSGSTYFISPCDAIRLTYNDWTSGTATISIRQADAADAQL